jgi:hypothetical protein
VFGAKSRKVNAVDDKSEKNIAELFAEGTEIDKALALAVRDALWRHKQLGNPVAIWRDGRVVWIPPEEIPVEKRPL